MKEANLAAKKAESMRRMMADLKVDRAQNPAAFANDRWERQDEGDADGEDDVDVELDDVDIIDRSALFLFIRLSAELPLLIDFDRISQTKNDSLVTMTLGRGSISISARFLTAGASLVSTGRDPGE